MIFDELDRKMRVYETYADAFVLPKSLLSAALPA